MLIERATDKPAFTLQPVILEFLTDQLAEAVAWTVYRRQNCTTTYGCVNPYRQLYLDDARALGRKYDLVNAYDAIDPMIAVDGADRIRYSAVEGNRVYLVEESLSEAPTSPGRSAD